jgi:hypothetical protein
MNTKMSLFSQAISLIDRRKFNLAVAETKAEKHAKGYTCWNQFVSMMFCHFAQAKSLREISYGLKTCEGKLSHLGISDAPNKSTLSYANNHRPSQVFKIVFYETLDFCYKQSPGKKKKFRFKNKLLSLDSTIIALCLTLFPWAKFRQTKGAVKLHILLDHEGYLPAFAQITDGKKHDVTVAKAIKFAKGSIIVIDRAYNDYGLFCRLTQDEVFFVCRMKTNAVYRIVKKHSVPSKGNIKKDCLIEWQGYYSKKKCPMKLRMVVAYNEEKKEDVYFLTNNYSLSASTIAAIYKDRWEIELFFKTLKQHLRIKTFVGTTPNALYTQIWTALTAVLLIKYMQFRSELNWALSTLVALLRWNLFTYRNLWEWLNEPWKTPRGMPENIQLKMIFGTASGGNGVK